MNNVLYGHFDCLSRKRAGAGDDYRRHYSVKRHAESAHKKVCEPHKSERTLGIAKSAAKSDNNKRRGYYYTHDTYYFFACTQLFRLQTVYLHSKDATDNLIARVSDIKT